mgnify:CR=1 FL=1
MKDLKTTDRTRIQWMLLVSALFLLTAAILGGVIRSLDDLEACGGWPLCGGRWLPSAGGVNLWPAYLHRLFSGLAFLSGSISLIFIFRKARRSAHLLGPVLLANLVMAVQVGLGAALDSGWGRGTSTAVHFGLALIAQALFVYPLVVSYLASADRKSRPFSRRYLRVNGLVLILVGLVLVSGAVVAALDAAGGCAGWPLCRGFSLELNAIQRLEVGHRLSVLTAGIGLAVLLIRAWQEARDQPALLTAAAAALVLFISQGLMGAAETAGSYSPALRSLHQAAAVGVWTALIVHSALLIRLYDPAAAPREQEAARDPGKMARDLFNLTKPIVVALLLVTTYAGMVIGAEAWPPVRLTFWVLLAGFMAAGGSGAINQFIDRADDRRMQRTRERPIPSGRLTPAEGLAFGVALTVAAFYLMAAFVNMTAALLTLAGAVYYVLIYSILLKKTTVHNIVIGGGAGALPPLVGWAAAAGSLNIPSLFLFAVVFMWTPPHFWALAIVRRKDYARADVPMLPVVQGVKETRRQILIYTIELVILTLLLPLFGLGGSIYFVLALGLGGWLLSAAWKVFKGEGNRVAWRMYRYSSMYLAFLFAALMADALI